MNVFFFFFSFVLDCLLALRARCYAGPIYLDLVIKTRSLLPHSSDRDPGTLHQTPDDASERGDAGDGPPGQLDAAFHLRAKR